MTYQVRDEDLPKIIEALRIAEEKYRHLSGTMARDGFPRLAQSFASQAADAQRIADEMEAEG